MIAKISGDHEIGTWEFRDSDMILIHRSLASTGVSRLVVISVINELNAAKTMIAKHTRVSPNLHYS